MLPNMYGTTGLIIMMNSTSLAQGCWSTNPAPLDVCRSRCVQTFYEQPPYFGFAFLPSENCLSRCPTTVVPRENAADP
ncbi:unnamed protein product [Dicrocoelium dendriticum]|nr:unnamed protein product [Dicrocoelium dendriticum]